MSEEIESLVIRAKSGDKDAFGKLYSLFLKRIFRFIYYLVYDYELTQDLTQNTFLKAWRALPSFSLVGGSFQAFLFTIARNLVIDSRRRRKVVSIEAIGEIESNEDLEERVDTEGRRHMIHKALATLDDFEKYIVILRYFEELSFSEIAKVVGKREGAVRVRVHRALKKLKGVVDRQ